MNAADAGVFPVDLQVQSLVPGLNLLSAPFGTLTGGVQNDVGLNETVEVVAFGNGSVGTNTPLLEIAYSLDSSFIAPNQFTVRLLDTTSIGDLAPGALTPLVVNAPVGVPEPSSFLLIGLVLGAVGLKKFYSTKKSVEEDE